MNILQKIIDETDNPNGWKAEEKPRGERQIIPTTNVQKAKLTKTFLRTFIKWSSSRYNAFKKAEVVNIAYDILSGAAPPQVFSSGSYCECSAMTRTGTYLIHGPEKYIATVKEVWNPETRVDDLHQIERVEF